MAGVHTRRYGGGIIIGREYTPAAAACLSPGARGARSPLSLGRGGNTKCGGEVRFKVVKRNYL